MKKEIQLIELKDKIRKAEKEEDGIENSLFWAVFGFLGFSGVASYFFIKKPEQYFYPGLIFASIAVLFLLFLILSLNWYIIDVRKAKKN